MKRELSRYLGRGTPPHDLAKSQLGLRAGVPRLPAAATRSVGFPSTSLPKRRGINTIKLLSGGAITNTRLGFEQSDLRSLNACRAA